MVPSPGSLDRRAFLAAGGASLVPWSKGASTVVPEPAVAWTFQVPDETRASVRLATRDGVYVTSETSLHALSAGGKLRWASSFDGDWPDVRPASVDGETLYVAVDGEIHAVERGDGQVRWRTEDDERWNFATVSDRSVIVLGDRLAALSATDGRVRWTFDAIDAGVMDPVVSAGVVVVGSVDGSVHAVNVTTGTERWTFERPYDTEERTELQVVDVVESVRSSDSLVLVWDRSTGRLIALNLTDGSERWRFDSDTNEFVFPGLVTADAVFAPVGESLVALAPEDGSERWRFEADATLRWPTTASHGAVYITDDDGTLYARSRADGTERWRFSTGVDDSLVTSRTPGDVLAVDDWNGTLYGLEPRDGGLRWAYEYGGETAWFPQVVGERVYLGTRASVVHALDPPPATALNRFRRDAANAEPATLLGPLLAGGALGGLLALASRRFDGTETDEPPTWNDFELRERIGEGPAGAVHRARAPDGDVVALKQFDVPVAEFRDAIETWAALDHDGVLANEVSQGSGERSSPGVLVSEASGGSSRAERRDGVLTSTASEGSKERSSFGVLAVHDWGIDPDPWVATEYAEGGNLADHLADFDRRAAVEVVSTVAEIVHRAHREGVVHGRLHSGNVLFDDDGEVLVGDWLGAATRADLPSGYAAPEQRDGDGVESIAVDVYQLGSLAVHTLTGDPPSGGAFDDEGIPAELADVLSTALEPDPEARHDSALRFRDLLRWAALQA